MASYRIRYADYAAEQLTGSYSTTFPEMGIILYVVSDKIEAVTFLRVNWGHLVMLFTPER